VTPTSTDDEVTTGADHARRAVRVVLSLLVVVATAVFLVANRHDIPRSARAVRSADAWWLSVALLLSLALVCAHGLARRAAMGVFGVHLAPARALVAGAVAHSLNIVAKSGGMAGSTVYREEARRSHQPPGLATGGYILAVVLGDASFALVLVASLGVLVSDGRFTAGDAAAAGAFTVYLAILVSAVVASARSRGAIRTLHAIPARLRRREPDHTGADELFDAIQQVRRRPAAVLPALGWMLLLELLGIGIVWSCLASYGQRTSITVPLVGYGISVLFSIIGVLPAGLGFAEASLGAVLVSFEVPGATAAVVVLSYRLFETWLPLALGLVLARRWRREGRVERP
jgi:uncharacterized membrane protein YbhN (UPF0104 family)